MNIPKIINILGYTYKIVICNDVKAQVVEHLKEEDKQDEYNGYFLNSTSTIYLSSQLSSDMLLSVFLHEVLEIICSHLSIKIPHEDIDRLEVGLYLLLLQNKLLR